jgi:NADH:ubiquinone oxidoreductase subunit 6 (subunit J)
MTTSLTTARSTDPVAPDSRSTAPRTPGALLTPRRVVLAAIGLVVCQLAFRAWMTYSSWYTFDDFNFISRTRNAGIGVETTMEAYAGHLMPAGLYLSWLADELAPFDFRVNATVLLAMQVLADAGAVVMLVRLFGARPGILPPLAVYLFCVISVPVAIWWAAGVNQIPMQITLFWALASHVAYLRTQRSRHLLTTMAWLLFGLLFYEKVLLVLGALAIITLAYFTTGRLSDRLRQVWHEYRPAAVAYALLGGGYLAVYAEHALNFSPREAGNDALGEVISNMVFQAYLPAVVGGPFQWLQGGPQFSLAAPSSLVVLASVGVWWLVLREAFRSRSNAFRAWLVPAFFLLCDIVLVVAGRASFVGPLLSLDFRYQGELPAATAIALACCTMTIVGAKETVERRAPSALLDDHRRVATATAVVAVLGVVGSLQYLHHWTGTMPAKPYFGRLLGSLSAAQDPVPLVDAPVPAFVMWPLGYPENALSHVLRAQAGEIDFRRVATDDLQVVDSTGTPVPAVVTTVRRNEPGRREGCGWSVARRSVSVPLDGPVAFGGWWVRVGYLASARGPMTVTAGDASYTTVVEPGVHALYLEGGGTFDAVTFSALPRGVRLCTDDIVVGRVRPVTEPSEATP